MKKPKEGNLWDPRVSFHLPSDGVLYDRLQKHLPFGSRRRVYQALLECLCDYLDARGELGIALLCSQRVVLKETVDVISR